MAGEALTVTIDDAVVKAKLHALTGFAQRHVAETALKAGALPIQNAAKRKAPKKTGTLSRSIHTEAVEEVGTLGAVKIGTDVIYARIHEYGGVIKPVHARMLHFQIDGRDIFAKQVTIPARPYLRPALAENRHAAIEATTSALRQLLEQAIA